MRKLAAKIKPAGGFAHLLHILFTIILPLLIFVLVRINLIGLAVTLVLLGKWRMFAVKPRHWPANIRGNAVDIIVGISVVIFMAYTDSQALQLIWAMLYSGWLILLKPQAGALGVSAQAMIGQVVGLSALFLRWGDAPLYILVLSAWVICYVSIRHFFTSFEEPLTRFLSYIWAYFAAALVWLLGHLLLFYGDVSQPALLLSVIGFGLASLYYLEKDDRLSQLLRRQIIFITMTIIIIVLVFSDWGDKAI